MYDSQVLTACNLASMRLTPTVKKRHVKVKDQSTIPNLFSFSAFFHLSGFLQLLSLSARTRKIKNYLYFQHIPTSDKQSQFYGCYYKHLII